MRTSALVMVLLGSGMLLRVVYCAGNDVRHVHDDHFHVIRIMVEEHRWPRPDEGWQTYQPPLYHALGAVVYSGTRSIAESLGATTESAHAAGRKAVQFVSAIAGCIALIFVWMILKCVFGARPALATLGLAVAAFLPRHVYLSGMATNDSLATMWMTIAMCALIRWHASGGAVRWAIVAGVTCGLAMLTKAYGLATLGVMVAAAPLAVLARIGKARDDTIAPRAEAGDRQISACPTPSVGQVLAGGAAMIMFALLVGAWPYARNARLCGSPFVSNYDLLPHAIWHQPPGRVSDVSFTSFRLGAVMDHPWLHITTVDSFWTQIYAEAWFDSGTTMTLYHYHPFARHISRAWSNDEKSPMERFVDQLSWESDVTPASELAAGRALLALGLIPTALMLVGLVVGMARISRSFPIGLLAVNLLANLAIPVFQTIRQPHFSSMKATFCIGALASGAVLVAFGAEALGWRRRRWLRGAVVVNFTLLGVVLAMHLVHVAFFPPDYFMLPSDEL